MEKVVFEEYNRKLPINKIDVSSGNVRKTGKLVGIPELSGSIARIGLIHPVIVMSKGDRFELIVGQRRLAAFKELGWETIPALITDHPLDDLSQMVISFGENIHRKKLPYNDTINVCSKLFKEFEGSPVQKINQIGKDLGLSRQTVIRYLAYQLVPLKVRQMVEEEKLTAKKAYDITSAYWPDQERIISIASLVDSLTSAEFDRAIEIGQASPKAPLEKVVEEAKKPPTIVTFVITMPIKMMKELEKEAEIRETDVHGIILTSIETFLSDGA